MPTLNRSDLAQGKFSVESAVAPAGASRAPVRVLQIGDGNFLRAFADWMIDVANGAGVFNGEVVMAQPLSRGIAERLNEQDGLFTVLLRGVQNGAAVESTRIVSCVKQALNPYSEWQAMLAVAQDPTLRFVISNTTEAGIAYVPEDLVEGRCPESFPAKVTALLLARYRALGAGAQSGLVFLPCELIEANGSKLQKFVLQYAQERLYRLSNVFDARRNRVGTLIGRGDLARQLTVQQESADADLVVLGQEHRSWLMDLLRGSVPRRLLAGGLESDLLVVPHAYLGVVPGGAQPARPAGRLTA